LEEFNLVDLLDVQELPLKNRINQEGYYAPAAGGTCTVPEKVRQRMPVARKEDRLIPVEPLKPGEQYRFHFDMTRCVGCQCCVVACNEQNNNPATVNWRRVGEIEGGIYPNTKRFHLSMACNHCLDPACLTGCPTDAYVKLEDTGVVAHKEEECIGCGYCTWNCPYSVPQFNPERRIVTKCDMCHNRLADGLEPACVASCPEQAIRIEKVNVAEWREDHTEADAPYLAESKITLSTTRITLPEEIPSEVLTANRHRVEPEKPHYSLILMTVLTQLAAGGFLTLWLGEILSHAFQALKPLQEFLVVGASGILAVTGLALSVSVFHLGRPLHAYKALRMWKRSWLSREVLLFTLFSFLGAVYAGLLLAGAYFHLSIPYTLKFNLGAAVALAGMGGIFASAKIYLVPARPAWNTIRTPLRFFLTGFILGPLFAFTVYSFYSLIQSPDRTFPLSEGAVAPLLSVAATAAFLQLAALLFRVLHLFQRQSAELYGSTVLLLRKFRTHFVIRVGLLAVGGFLLPLEIFQALRHGGNSAVTLFSLSAASFLISLVGELMGRYLFFVTVVPKNIPGSFFTTNGGGH
jgi:DMSO reductase iron-sulfur subunit